MKSWKNVPVQRRHRLTTVQYLGGDQKSRQYRHKVLNHDKSGFDSTNKWVEIRLILLVENYFDLSRNLIRLTTLYVWGVYSCIHGNTCINSCVVGTVDPHSHVYLHTCAYVCVHVCVCLCMYSVCMYTHKYGVNKVDLHTIRMEREYAVVSWRAIDLVCH